ncbi:MAG: hypothetical protein HY329_17955, partial [Chloroflexi bacterium]|nr:hypothetical protein [Chloroflexota bacterium]
ELTAAQQRTEQRLEELAAAQQRTEQRLEELAAAQQRTEQRLEELAAAQQRTEQRLEELAAAQAQTQGQLAALITRVGGITDSVDDLSTRTDVLTARVDTLRDQVGKLIGTDLEHRYRDRATSYFEPLAKRLRVLDRGRIADLLDDAVEAGQLTRTERNAVLAADLFLSGRRRDDQADVFLVVEISATIALSDVRRALERAALLARLGRPAMPVVAGESIRSDASGFAREHAVAQVLDGGVET